MSPSQDFHRDWNRWTTAERVTAAALGLLVIMSVPGAIFVNAHPFREAKVDAGGVPSERSLYSTSIFIEGQKWQTRGVEELA